MKRKHILVLLLSVMMVGANSGCRRFLIPVRMLMDQNPGPFKQKTYTAIVEEVRSRVPNGTEEMTFRILDFADISSLQPSGSNELIRGQNAGTIWASKNSFGELKVVIQTKDLGHAGEYGFAYSDVPLHLTSFGEHWYYIDVPGRLNIATPKMQINQNWWKVVYNLG